jgi:endo-1,4-beta-xylanase
MMISKTRFITLLLSLLGIFLLIHSSALAYSVAKASYQMQLNVNNGALQIKADTATSHQGPPLAHGLDKFLGNIYAPDQIENFENYWNQVTPENASKWQRVEDVRGVFTWEELDSAYNLAKDNGWPFHFHVLVWGNQQPRWMADLADKPEEQLEAIDRWFNAVAERYPDIDYLEVVNEPIHDPPDFDPDYDRGGNYIDALGGTGETGWDWVITAFEMARDIFPESTKFMINEYNIVNNASNAAQYVEIIELLKERELIDVIGVQGHAFSTRGSAAGIIHNLNTLAETGLPIKLTEMEFEGNPHQNPDVTEGQSDQNQLETIQRVFPAVWEHPAVIGVTFWGWRPGLWRHDQEAYLVRENGESRPALKWLKEYMEEYRTVNTSVEIASTEKAVKFNLKSNYPNPFNPSTQITFEIVTPVEVSLSVFDITGRKIETLIDRQPHSPGMYSATFDASHLSSGVYLYKMRAGTFHDIKQMTLIK